MTRLFAFVDWVNRTFLGIAMLALFTMMMSIVVDVFMRYVFNAAVVGAYDMVEICLVVAIFFSIGALISGSHEILIDLIDQFVSVKSVIFLKRLTGLVSAVVFIFIFISMLTPAIQSYQYGEMRLELKMPVWIAWVFALVGMSGGVLAAIKNVLKPRISAENQIESGRDQA